MPYRIFLVSIRDPEAGQTELNGFLGSHRVVAVERRWIEEGMNSCWSFCVEYLNGTSETTKEGSALRRNRVDYKEILTPEEFSIFAKLRDARAAIAKTETVPVYVPFTNDQLAQMVQTKATTKADLKKIEGIGEAKIEKYGEAILAILSTAWRPSHETNGTPVRENSRPG